MAKTQSPKPKKNLKKSLLQEEVIVSNNNDIHDAVVHEMDILMPIVAGVDGEDKEIQLIDKKMLKNGNISETEKKSIQNLVNVDPSKVITKGGHREGAGRKPKPLNARDMFKRAFDKHFTQEQWDNFVLDHMDDPRFLSYMIDQRIGKPSQAVEHSGAVDFIIRSAIPRPNQQ